MGKKIFITGTGTDIGKTYVSGVLARTMKAKNLNCGYYKPVLSGAVLKDGVLHPGDCEFVIQTGGLEQNAQDAVSYVFEEAVSPHLAAKHTGIKIDKNKILSDYNRIGKEFEYLIVEGAGGITCPIVLDDETYLMSDLIKDMEIDCLIAADGGLGTINSVLLTYEWAKKCGINVKGVILNRYIYGNTMYEDNLKSIEKLCGIPVTGLIKESSLDIDLRGYELSDLFSGE